MLVKRWGILWNLLGDHQGLSWVGPDLAVEVKIQGSCQLWTKSWLFGVLSFAVCGFVAGVGGCGGVDQLFLCTV